MADWFLREVVEQRSRDLFGESQTGDYSAAALGQLLVSHRLRWARSALALAGAAAVAAVA